MVGVVMNRRSLLRRIGILIESNRIRANGAFKGRIYCPLSLLVSDDQGVEESNVVYVELFKNDIF